MRVALEAGAEDVVPNADNSIEVLADPVEFETVRAILTDRGFVPAAAEVTERASLTTPLSGRAGGADGAPARDVGRAGRCEERVFECRDIGRGPGAHLIPAPRARRLRRAGASLRILGLDPGSRRTGLRRHRVPRRGLGTRRARLCDVCRPDAVAGGAAAADLREPAGAHREHAPGEVAIERVFVNRNVDSALKLGQARGAALCAVPKGLPVFEYAPRAIKLALVGSGAAEKAQVAHMIRTLLALQRAHRSRCRRTRWRSPSVMRTRGVCTSWLQAERSPMPAAARRRRDDRLARGAHRAQVSAAADGGSRRPRL